MATREEKLKKIQEVMSDRTLNPGCRYSIGGVTYLYETDNSGQMVNNLMDYYRRRGKSSEVTVIGHPVMIGDVLDRLYYSHSHVISNLHDPEHELFFNGGIGTEVMHLMKVWYYKRKPIDDQTDECVDYIYSPLLMESNK